MALDDQLGLLFPQAPQSRRIWAVRELVGAARTLVESKFTDVWVEGEISNYRPADSGHLYFTLKDGDAQLNLVMFSSRARLLRFRPANGMQIVARGRMTIYDARGQLQLAAEYLEPKGAGALQVAFEQLKAKLQGEGLFERERKQPIPAFPRRVGIVTSPRGAAIQDILNILRRRHAGINVLIFPAQVQGEAAAHEVSAGVKYFNRAGLAAGQQVDVIVVARGGGSVEDLAAFNDEGLARAIAASKIPVISAVGHETDFSIADFVADLRAPTPSAAAELVIESQAQLQERVHGLRQRLSRVARYRVVLARNRLMQLSERGTLARIADAMGRRGQRVDELIFRLRRAQETLLQEYRRRLDVFAARMRHHEMRRVLAGLKRQLGALSHELGGEMRRVAAGNRARLDALSGKLDALSPHNILERGYALVFDAQGRLLRDISQVRPGDAVRAHLARGQVSATVTGTAKDSGGNAGPDGNSGIQ